MPSHPTWVRGLKLELDKQNKEFSVSHPTWVRGLKLVKTCQMNYNGMSHPTWVRGLKPEQQHDTECKNGRTLRGCVD